MIKLINRRNGEVLGELPEAQFDATFGECLVSEGPRDVDYYVTAETLEGLTLAGVWAELVAAWGGVLMGEVGVDVGWEPQPAGAEYTLRGQVLNAAGEPAGGFCVTAFDEDVFTPDDYLGWAFTRPDGSFELGFTGEDFKERFAGVDLEGAPEVYLRVLDWDGEERLRTEVRQQEGSSLDWGELRLPGA